MARLHLAVEGPTEQAFARQVLRPHLAQIGVYSPELIDDGANTAPSKRIIALIPQYGTTKRARGPLIAAAIGLPAIRAKCPHFDAWIKRLEELGTKLP